LIDLSIGQSVH